MTVFEKTCRALQISQPRSHPSVLAARRLITQIIEQYSSAVARNEVGSKASAIASTRQPISGCPTGLLYGRIQSGKTQAVILTSALAIDAGFRTVIVLTSDSTELVRQTARRFMKLQGPMILGSHEADSWAHERANLQAHLSTKGAVFVCQKNATRMKQLLGLLADIKAAEYPALVVDDEADQATPDANQVRRSRNQTVRRTKINRLATALDPDEEGQALRQLLRHNVMLQVTATPNALFLQRTNDPLRPKFGTVLQPGVGYCGGEHFFGSKSVTDGTPPLVFIAESEGNRLTRTAPAPEGLRSAVTFFLVSAADLHLRDPQRVSEHAPKFLAHTSARQNDHRIVVRMISELLNDISSNFQAHMPVLQAAYVELQKTTPSPADFSDIADFLRDHIPHRKIHEVNATGNHGEYSAYFDFLIGGNILGRGLTIENLLVTYYSRRSQTPQMDTIQQHARMYGYRDAIMGNTRVYLPKTLAQHFRDIHLSEEMQRKLFASNYGNIPVKIVRPLRATRIGVIPPGTVGTFSPGQQVYQFRPLSSGSEVARVSSRIETLVKSRFSLPSTDYRISIKEMSELIELFPADQEPRSWISEILVSSLAALKADGLKSCNFRWRPAPRRKGPTLESGILGDREYRDLVGLDRPTLALAKMTNLDEWEGIFWTPTVVFPRSSPILMFNLPDAPA